jgi:hypothetical protein
LFSLAITVVIPAVLPAMNATTQSLRTKLRVVRCCGKVTVQWTVPPGRKELTRLALNSLSVSPSLLLGRVAGATPLQFSVTAVGVVGVGFGVDSTMRAPLDGLLAALAADGDEVAETLVTATTPHMPTLAPATERHTPKLRSTRHSRTGRTNPFMSTNSSLVPALCQPCARNPSLTA